MNEQVKQLILKYLDRVEIKGLQEISEINHILSNLIKTEKSEEQ